MKTERKLYLMQQTYATLFSLANKLQGYCDRHLEKLTNRQLMTMIAIAHLPEGLVTINAVAAKLGTTKQNTRQLVETLERKGHVTIAQSSDDKRSVDVQFTAKGLRALESDGIRGSNLFSTIFHEFSSEELETLWSLLRKLYRFDGNEQDGFEAEASIFFEEGE
jgi:DNA-binding MarR family transcriptional regulator